MAASASAQLSFDETRASVRAEPGTEAITAAFRCTNSGKKPVKIVRVRTTCGCTTVSKTVDELAPGASTELAVRMEIRIDGGVQRKGVVVEIDRAPFAYELEIEAVIPELLKATPAHLTWVMGQAAATRTVNLVPDEGVTVVDASSSDPNFAISLAQQGANWRLRISPAKLDKRRFARVTVRYRHDGEELEGKVLLSIIQPPPTTKSWLQRLFDW